jgi:PST family polysaccharide transporter
MIAGFMTSASQLLVRSLIQRSQGPEALGHFHAAWTISMTYIGFVLQAMGTDYYPRLTAAIRDHAAVNKMVNQQTEIALLLAGPIFIAMIALAPWTIDLLYSSHFAEAAAVLRWQILGDILKVISWPLGFIILSAGEGRTFIFTELSSNATFVAVSWLGLPLLGVKATGLGFLAMYVVLLPIVYGLAHARTGFRWDNSVIKIALLIIGLSIAVMGIIALHPLTGVWLGCISSAALGFYALTHIAHVDNLDGRLKKISGWANRIPILPRPRRDVGND